MLNLPKAEQIQLWLNIEREWVRRSMFVTQGIAAGFGEADENYWLNFTNEGMAKLQARRTTDAKRMAETAIRGPNG